MKKWVLLGVMGVCVALLIGYWVGTLLPGLPIGVYLYDLGRLLALTGFAFVFFQFVWSSKVKWIERRVGLDKLFALHRTCGKVGLTLIAVHPAMLYLSDFVLGYGFSITRWKLVGATSLALFALAAGSAILYHKLDLRYETWKTIHWAGYVALPLAFWHNLSLGSDLASQPLRTVWLILAALYVAILIHKLWMWLRIRRRPYQVVRTVQETHDTWSLHFSGPRVEYKPGQFLILRLVRGGKVSEPHPFTLSSSPTWDTLSVSIKSVGDFTATVRHTETGDQAYIDAPYGVFSYLHHDAPNLAFIAGGIGITPFMSMLRYMRDKGIERNVLLIWGNKTEDDIAFRSELEEIAAAMPTLRIVHVMSRQQDWPGERGYVDAALLARYLSDTDRPLVFVCGPPVMTGKVIPHLLELGIPRGRIHYERFALR